MINTFRFIAPLSCLLFFVLGCINPVNHEYRVKQKADLSKLLIFEDGLNIFGVDTVDFTVKAQISVDNIVFGGAAKLPNGGVAFTHHRSKGGAWGSKLYVTDRNCTLQGTYDICASPMGPAVINNLLFVGSSGITPPGVNFEFQILDANNFSLKKEFLFRDMVNGWHISHCNDKAYIGINPDSDYPDYEYSYIVELDLNTLDTVIITDTTEFFLNAYFLVEKYGSLLYIFSSRYIFSTRTQDIYIYDLDTKTIRMVATISKIPLIATMQEGSLSHPRIYNGYLYGLFTEPYYYEVGIWKQHLVKFDMNTLEYISHVSLNELSEGTAAGSEITYQNRFLIRHVGGGLGERFVLFEDMETGQIEHRVTLGVK